MAQTANGGSLASIGVTEGRPIYAVWSHASTVLVASIDRLILLRLLGLVALSATGFALTRIWNRDGFEGGAAAAASIAILTLPPFQVLASWASAAVVPFACLAAVVAGHLAQRAADAVSTRRKWFTGFLSAAVLSGAFLTYQPAGLFIVVVAAIQGLGTHLEPVRFRRLAAAHALVLSAALVIAFAAYRAGSTFGSGEVVEGRLRFAGDPAFKFDWFVSVVLPQAFNLWNLQPSSSLATILAILTFSGMWLHLRTLPDRAFRLLLCVVLIPMAYLPSLVISESWPTYRSQLALMPLVLVYAVIGVSAHVRWLGAGGFRSVAVAFGVIGALATPIAVTVCFAVPLATELRAVRTSFALMEAGKDTIVVRQSRARDSFAPLARYDEFGVPATALPWGAQALPYLVAREGSRANDVEVVAIRWDDAAEHDVDLGLVLRQLGSVH